jgi:hypothetical protein
MTANAGSRDLGVASSDSGTQAPEAVLLGIANPEQVRGEILAARNAYLASHKLI